MHTFKTVKFCQNTWTIEKNVRNQNWQCTHMMYGWTSENQKTIRRMNSLRLSTSAPLTPFLRTSVVAKRYCLQLSTFLFHQIPFFGVGISNNCSATTTAKEGTKQTTRSAADTAHCATNAFDYFTCQKRRPWIVISPCWPLEIILSNLLKFVYIRGV